MIYCSRCGTHNRDGSKFCSNCAARLTPPSGLVCPMCSTPNPVENVFCSNCSARLVPLTGGQEADRREAAPPIRGLSLPIKPLASPEEEPPESTADEKIEDWLTKLRESPPIEDGETLPPPGKPLPASYDVPTWTKDADRQNKDTSTIPASESAERAPSMSSGLEDQAGLPNWLRNVGESNQVSDEGVAEEKATQPADAQASQGELPQWIGLSSAQEDMDSQARETSEEEESSATPPMSDASIPQPASEGEMPDWLTELKPRDDSKSDTPEETYLSDWLRTPIMDSGKALPVELTGETETLGPMAGLRGVLPVAHAVTLPHSVTKPMPPRQNEQAQLFDNILSTSQAQLAYPSRRRGRRAIVTVRGWINALLALAVIIPFFLPLDLTGSSLRISGTLAAEYFDAIQSLPAASSVLVAFDYDPGTAGEMDLLAHATLRHLAKRRARILTLSTLEPGPLMAHRTLSSAIGSTTDYSYGTDYLNLGYLPGNEAGLAQLAIEGLPVRGRDFQHNQPIGPYPIVTDMPNVKNFAMVIVLAGSEDQLRIWMEQFQPRTSARISAAVSAAVEPRARAYRDANQLSTLVSGAVGAAQYEVLSNQPGSAVRQIAAQSAAHIVIIVAIVLGNMAYWIGRLRGREH